MRLSCAEQMRQADHIAIHERGIPSTLLMRRAAEYVAAETYTLAGQGGRVAVFCGSGNNGGDGVAAAQMLLLQDCEVRVFLCGKRENLTADTAEMICRLEEADGRLEDFDEANEEQKAFVLSCDAIVDAIFGIGLSRPVAGKAALAITLMNESKAPVVAADIASGVDADTGAILGNAVSAAVTVTFSMAKPGHFAEPGCTHCGRLRVVDIGVPKDILDGADCGVHAIEPESISLPKRDPLTHKGDYGKLLLLGGSVGYTGAPTLCAKAAVRSGAGLVWLGVPERIYPITAVKNDEAMPFPVTAWEDVEQRLANCSVCAVGPGLGRSDEAVKLVHQLVSSWGGKLVLDADALYALSLELDLLKHCRATMVLTPHEGEFARLGGVVGTDRIGVAKAFAKDYGCVLVLKGHRTLAAFPDGEVYIATVGNPGMAKGGSGDVLTGIMAAMLGQFEVKKAVITALHLHGLAGDLAAEEQGEYAMTATDLLEKLPEATKIITKQE